MDEHWYLQAQPALFPQSGGQDLLGQLHPGFRLPLEGMGAAPETGKRGPRAGTEQSSSGSRRVWASCLVGRGYSVSWQVCDLGQVSSISQPHCPTCGVRFPGWEVLLASGTLFSIKCPTLERSGPSLFSPMHLPSLDSHHLIQNTASLPPSIPISQREISLIAAPRKPFCSWVQSPGHPPSWLQPSPQPCQPAEQSSRMLNWTSCLDST